MFFSINVIKFIISINWHPLNSVVVPHNFVAPYQLQSQKFNQKIILQIRTHLFFLFFTCKLFYILLEKSNHPNKSMRPAEIFLIPYFFFKLASIKDIYFLKHFIVSLNLHSTLASTLKSVAKTLERNFSKGQRC